jgi:cyclic beta-1,2-glucan synthetase
MYRILLESMLGFRRRGDVLTVEPCVPKRFERFEIEFQYRGKSFSIHVENPNAQCSGVSYLEIDGKPVTDRQIRLDLPGDRHHVRVVIGGESEVRAFAHAARSDGTRFA